VSGTNIILSKLNMSEDDIRRAMTPALQKGTGGELYMAQGKTMSLSLEDNIVRSPGLTTFAGGGLRRINGTVADMVSFNDLTEDNLTQACAYMQGLPTEGKANVPVPAQAGKAGQVHYPADDVFAGKTLSQWGKLLQDINTYVRDKDSRVLQASINLFAEGENVLIARADGRVVSDHRPLCRLYVTVILKENGRKESGSDSLGGRYPVDVLFDNIAWQRVADNALKQAENNLSSVEIKAGDDYDIVVTNGWGGVILHEAFGHGLEADFHRKGIAAFQNKIGERIAAKGVSVVDDGTLDKRRGSLNFDDEGNPPNTNLLVDDGILVGLMTDEISAAALNMPLTGNARRESYDAKPMPRMTNTYMLPGDATVEELIKDVKKGIFTMSFSGGQVDITSGEFVFVANEARLIENGKLGPYVKGASLGGDGREAYKHVTGVAGDLDHGDGNCGKDGQTVPVCVGQPTIRINKGSIKVGGTG